MDEQFEKIRNGFAKDLSFDRSNVKDLFKYQSIVKGDCISLMVFMSEIEESFNISINIGEVFDIIRFAKPKIIIFKFNIALS